MNNCCFEDFTFALICSPVLLETITTVDEFLLDLMITLFSNAVSFNDSIKDDNVIQRRQQSFSRMCFREFYRPHSKQ